jgi:alanyl-tRNA synthetase
MGGQVGDTGYIESESGERINILNTIKENNLTIHVAEKLPSDGTQTFSLHVDAPRRLRITNNHTATHLLDQALREILGPHVEQKGSFVGPDYFRFDFSHFQKVTDEELKKTEQRVNELIRENNPLEEKRDATMDEAKAMGAIALFGEKYGDRVRIVKFGKSVELCGGCHAKATGQIGMFKILSESAVAAGVRRIEAVTGAAAEDYVYGIEDVLKSARSFFNNAPDITSAIRKMISENDAYKKQAEEMMKEKTARIAEAMLSSAEEKNGIRLVKIDSAPNPLILRNAATILVEKEKSLAIAAAVNCDGKPQLLLAYSKDLVARGKNAGKDIREAASLIKGGGGGQPGFASAGGKDTEGLRAALAKLVEDACK